MEEGSESKKKIRQEMLRKRGDLSPAEVDLFSKEIAARLVELEAIKKARVVMGFMSIRNEVDLWPFLEVFRQEDKTVLLPRVMDHESIQAIPFQSKGALQKSPYGILEPVGSSYDPAQIDVVLVPGLAFDYSGHRIGYGRGYYDRFLPLLGKHTFICGVCYEFQVIASVYPDENDHAVDWIVTERSELMINERFF